MTTTTVRGTVAALALVALAAWLPASALGHSEPPRRCKVVKVHVRATRVVVRRVHGRRERVRVHYRKTVRKRVCKRRAGLVEVNPTPTIPKTAPLVAVHLRAHLDPSFTQSPTAPRDVTFQYSASASVATTLASVTTEAPAPALPEGVLQLVVQDASGSRSCSMNVGGKVTGGECPIVVPAFGRNEVTTTYLSGSTSATETTVDNIEPFSTTTTVTATQTECPPTEKEGKLYHCSYTVAVGTVDQNGKARVPTGLSLEWGDGKELIRSTEECVMGSCLDVSKPLTLEVTTNEAGTPSETCTLILTDWKGARREGAVGPAEAKEVCPTGVTVVGIYKADAITEAGWLSSRSEPTLALKSR